jgi:hypothetical protein
VNRWLPLLALVPACVLGVWSFPKEAPRVEAAAVLGEVLWETTDDRLVLSGATWQGGRIVVLVHHGDGYAGDDWSEVPAELFGFSIDPDTLEAEEIPAPSGLLNSSQVRFGYGLDPGTAVVVLDDVSFAGTLNIWDGASWTDLPLDVSPDLVEQALFHDGRVVIAEIDRIRVGADSLSLREIGPDIAAQASVVAWEGDDVQIVWRDDDLLCTATWSASTGDGGAETCASLPKGWGIESPFALSGTPDAFQVAVPAGGYRSLLYSFDQGAWTEGEELPISALLDHPGSPVGFAVATDLSVTNNLPDYVPTAHPTLYRVEDAAFVEKSLEDFHVNVPCDCVRGPGSDCTCIAHTVEVSQLLAAPDASALILFSADGIDATVRMQLRALPMDGRDPLHDGLDCPLECEWSRCDLDHNNEPFCEYYDDQLDPTE